MDDFLLRRKWTLRAHGKQMVFVKRPNEQTAHVLMKALIWALYLPTYPDLAVETAIGDRYKPDVVALDVASRPRFWGEAGQVGIEKIHSLIRRYCQTHFAIARWDTRLDPLHDIVTAAVTDRQRQAPFDLLRFPADSVERFIDTGGEICIVHNDLESTTASSSRQLARIARNGRPGFRAG
ncbi:MAG: hypothetical protein MI924_19110 [Chloroflexales bacterium]|nr:hypothetical protein [Chloroflexales bacterium]